MKEIISKLEAAGLNEEARQLESIAKAPWFNLPKGWTTESLKEFAESLTKKHGPKGFFTACVRKIKGTDITDPESFCASLKDTQFGTGWRKGRKTKGAARREN